jgi:hypothetical protein
LSYLAFVPRIDRQTFLSEITDPLLFRDPLFHWYGGEFGFQNILNLLFAEHEIPYGPAGVETEADRWLLVLNICAFNAALMGILTANQGWNNGIVAPTVIPENSPGLRGPGGAGNGGAAAAAAAAGNAAV